MPPEKGQLYPARRGVDKRCRRARLLSKPRCPTSRGPQLRKQRINPLSAGTSLNRAALVFMLK